MVEWWNQAGAVAAGGAAGALLRWTASNVITRWTGPAFPWATLVVNLAGCLCFGYLVARIEAGHPGALRWRLFALSGFLGAFTTFSSFAFETFALARSAGVGLAAVNVVAQNALGGILVVAGWTLGRPGVA
jgi:CrcB protein